MEQIHKHLMVQGKSDKDRVERTEEIAAKYDGDFWATTWFMVQYWFYGLAYITFAGPVLLVTMFIQGFFFLLDPSTMPGKITDEERFAGKNIVLRIWNWLSV